MPTLFVTAPPEDAEELASGIVEARLAACVNRVGCRSTYRWEGKINDEDEEILLVKTTDAAVEGAIEWIEEAHPYEVPCIERFEADDALPAFLEWQREVVDSGD